jgi:hypothetical protein
MSTVDTNIYVKKGIISIEGNGEKVEFKVFDAMKLPQNNHECFNIGVVQSIAKEILQVHSIDPLEVVMTHNLTKSEHGHVIDIIDVTHSLEASVPHLRRYTLPSETLVPTNTIFDPSIVRAPDLELRYGAYENAELCMERTKKYPNKLKSMWYGPYDVTKVFPH